MTPQRSDSEQPRTANDNTGDSLRDGMAAAYNRGLADGRAESGAASPSEPLQRLHRAVAGLPVHMGHGAIRAIEVLELIEAEQRAALAAPSQERASEPAGLDVERLNAAADHMNVGHQRWVWEKVAAEYARLTASAASQERASEPAGLDEAALAAILKRGNIGCEAHGHTNGAYHLASDHKEDAAFILDQINKLTASAAAQEDSE